MSTQACPVSKADPNGIRRVPQTARQTVSNSPMGVPVRASESSRSDARNAGSRGVEVVMDGRDREKDPHSKEDAEAVTYESISVEELDDRLRRAGIDPNRTIVAVEELLHSKLKE